MRRKRRLPGKRGKITFLGYVHQWDPFGLYISAKDLKKLGITHAVIESAEKYPPKTRKMLEEFYSSLSRGNHALYREYVRGMGRNSLSLSEKKFHISLATLLLGSGLRPVIEPGLTEKEFRKIVGNYVDKPIHIGFELNRLRTKKLFRKIKPLLRRGKHIAILHGAGHLPFIQMEARKRRIPFEAYVVGGIPVFIKGTPLMHPPDTEYAYKQFLKKPAQGEHLWNKMQMCSFVTFALLKKYARFRRNPTAAYHVASWISTRCRTPEEAEKFISSEEFERVIHPRNMKYVRPKFQ